MRVNRRGIPLTALAVSAIATGICVLVNYFMPGERSNC
jgi:aromatic amino acid transport protein AroP